MIQLLLLFMILLSGCAPQELHTQTVSQPSCSKTDVVRVIDGDTIEVSSYEDNVRLLLIDTPETVKRGTPIQPWGVEASNYAKEQLLGKEVCLEIDPKNVKDKYGRPLAYVWIDDRLFNKELVDLGLAKVAYISSKKAPHLEELQLAEERAKSSNLGIWSIP